MRALASAQDVTEPALKAAFIYNFALFTEWPADVVPDEAPFAICVINDAAVRDALLREVKGRSSPTGDVGLYRTEWYAAQRFGPGYWLMIAVAPANFPSPNAASRASAC